MFKYIMKKLVSLVLMTIAISLVIFLMVNATGVDPVAQQFSANEYDEKLVAARRHELGLDKPIMERYWDWITGLLHGDFGKSSTSGFTMKEAIKIKWPATFEIAFTGLVISSILGIGIGALSAYWQNGIIDYVGRFFAVLGNAVPSYFLALVLIQVFAIKLKWLPATGRVSVGSKGFFARIPNMVLPVTALSIPMCGSLMRYTRNTMLDMSSKEYVKFARSKGMPEGKIWVKHIFRNSLRPIITVLLSRATILIGGSVTIDAIFCWPGIGSMLSSAATSSDYSVVMFSALTTAIVMQVISFLMDMTTALLDPRVKLED